MRIDSLELIQMIEGVESTGLVILSEQTGLWSTEEVKMNSSTLSVKNVVFTLCSQWPE